MSGGAVSDADVKMKVHNGDQDQRHQHHHQEVGNENVIPGVVITLSNLCWANLKERLLTFLTKL